MTKYDSNRLKMRFSGSKDPIEITTTIAPRRKKNSYNYFDISGNLVDSIRFPCYLPAHDDRL